MNHAFNKVLSVTREHYPKAGSALKKAQGANDLRCSLNYIIIKTK